MGLDTSWKINLGIHWPLNDKWYEAFDAYADVAFTALCSHHAIAVLSIAPAPFAIRHSSDEVDCFLIQKVHHKTHFQHASTCLMASSFSLVISPYLVVLRDLHLKFKFTDVASCAANKHHLLLMATSRVNVPHHHSFSMNCNLVLFFFIVAIQ